LALTPACHAFDPVIQPGFEIIVGPRPSTTPLPGCQELVGSTATIYGAEVTAQIDTMANANREAWATFKCLFPATVAAWRYKTGRAD
jgi:hypothetical protein